jgi:hypothetical protein
MGTWPLSVVHESTGEGGFGSDAWQLAYFKYLDKWGGS